MLYLTQSHPVVKGQGQVHKVINNDVIHKCLTKRICLPNKHYTVTYNIGKIKLYSQTYEQTGLKQYAPDQHSVLVHKHPRGQKLNKNMRSVCFQILVFIADLYFQNLKRDQMGYHFFIFSAEQDYRNNLFAFPSKTHYVCFLQDRITKH